DINKAVVFGPDDQPDYGGAVAVGDARILAFPVRSLKGVMAWVTCRDVLARFARDATQLKPPLLPSAAPQPQADHTEAYASSEDVVLDGGSIVLEDYLYHQESYTFAAGELDGELRQDLQYFDDQTGQPRLIAEVWASWLARDALPQSSSYQNYYHAAFTRCFIILPDDDFRDFVLYSTEVTTRIKLNRDTKTVDGAALFTMEALPADSLLYVPIMTHKPRIQRDKLAGSAFDAGSTDEDVLRWLQTNNPPRIQIGGDETVGYGQVALRWGGVK
ncbi:MAG: type III-B CRISPR module RAMP protein Cmr4, partial [Anaerolinea sp.]|nr:type III-B CRISPR module RAMP protein Cmr4 [Anaerolinea sp.]